MRKKDTVHESSLLNNLLRKVTAIAEDNDADKVIGVKIKLGAMAHISPEHLREHFDRAVLGTVAEGAELHIQVLDDEFDPHAQEIVLDSVEVAAD